MPLSFSVIKERELRRILSEIETYLGKAGKEYAKDTCRDGKYNPELADLAKYRGHGWPHRRPLTDG